MREITTLLVLVVALAGWSGCKTTSSDEGESSAGDEARAVEAAPKGPAAQQGAAIRAAKPSEKKKAAGSEKRKPGPRYSAFGVRLHGGEHFNIISFKDVGLPRKTPTTTAPILEAVAQSVAYELEAHGRLDLQPEVVFDEALADPANHKYCESEHLYVDMWHSEEPERYGYSLWSGCGEAGKFAWEEIPVEADDSMTLAEQVTPLGKGIVDSFAEARQKGCFTSRC